jgi:WD40 repeat protein
MKALLSVEVAPLSFPGAAIPLLVAFSLSCGAAENPATESKPASKVSYYHDVRPILQANCQGCHQPAKSKGGYVMTEFKRLLAGGDNEGAAIVPSRPEKSAILKMITQQDGEVKMPKGKTPLLENEVAVIRSWIEQGANDDTPADAIKHFDADHPPLYSRPPVVASLDFSPDGKLLAVAGFHEVLLYEDDATNSASTPPLAGRLIGLSERIQSLRFSPDGQWLAVAGGDPARLGEIQVWDVANQKLKLSAPISYDTLYGLSWSPNGKLIAFGCPDNTVRAIEAGSGKQVLQMGSHSDWVMSTTFSVKGDHVISGGRDMSVKLTELASQRFIDNVTSITPGALKGGVLGLVTHPTLDHIVTAGSDGTPRVYRIFREVLREIGDDAQLIADLFPMQGRVFSVRFSADGKRIACGSCLDRAGELLVCSYDYTNDVPKPLRKIMGKVPGARKPAERKQLEDYKNQGIRELARVSLPQSSIYSVAFTPDGAKVAAAGSDGFVRYYNATNGALLKEFVCVPLTTNAPATLARVTEQSGRPKSEISTPSSPAPLSPESLPEGAQVTALELQPAHLKFTSPNEYAQLLVTARLASGDSVDVTRMVKFDLKPDLAEISPRGILKPTKDGVGLLTITLLGVSPSAGPSVETRIQITGLEKGYHADFVRDVSPVIARLGCNAGTCHGAKEGKNGFKLSLRGYDPQTDLRSLTDDMASRRVNLASPDDSLMLLKAIAEVPHEGGRRSTVYSKYYGILRQWIAEGAKLDLQSPRVTKIDLLPHDPVVQQVGARQQMRIVATYADGATRDVTAEAFIESGNTDIASMESAGLLTTLRRGEAPVLARYEGNYAATTLTVMGDRKGFVWHNPPAWGKIDELVAAKWKRMKIEPSDLCTDLEFIRRVYLDLTGLPPSAEEIHAFVDDSRETKVKRDEVVDRLIGSPEFVDFWANKWADLLQCNSKFLGTDGAELFRAWIRKEVETNTPYDQFAREILTATGSTKDNPAANYYKILRTPAETMENTTHLFLATRFNCNKCHDHPFERWTQDQYYHMAAYFAQVSFKEDPRSEGKKVGGTDVEGAKPLYEIVSDGSEGEVKHDRTGKVSPPEFPYPAKVETNANSAHAPAVAENRDSSPQTPATPTPAPATTKATAFAGGDPGIAKSAEAEQKTVAAANTASMPAKKKPTRREQLAAWITTPDNRFFASSYANRLWGYLTGVGIIEPLDDTRAGNPPKNPALLEYLTHEFIDSGFNSRHLMQLICQSRTYQLSISTKKWNEDDKVNYSHAIARRLPAETLFDSVFKVTGSIPQIPGAKPGQRATQLADAATDVGSGLLATLGRPARQSACECERTSDIRLGSVMALLSGPTISSAINDPTNAIAKLVESEKDDPRLVEDVFMRVLNRPASEAETKTTLAMLQRVDADHTEITNELGPLEIKMAPVIEGMKVQREEAIAHAKEDLATYDEMTKTLKAELEKRRQSEISMRKGELKDYEKLLPAEAAFWESKNNPGDAKRWFVIEPQDISATNDTKLSHQPDGSILTSGGKSPSEFLISAHSILTNITGVMLEVFPDDNLPRFGPGRHSDGNFVLSEIELTWAEGTNLPDTSAKFSEARADFSQNDFSVEQAIDGKVETGRNGWAINGAPGIQRHTATFKLEEPIAAGTNGVTLRFSLHQNYGDDFLLGRFRLSVTTNEDALDFGMPEPLVEAARASAGKRTPEQAGTIFSFYRSIDAEFWKRKETVNKASEALPEDPKLAELKKALSRAEEPIRVDPYLVQLRDDAIVSDKQRENKRLVVVQDLTWALINSAGFLFNH